MCQDKEQKLGGTDGFHAFKRAERVAVLLAHAAAAFENDAFVDDQGLGRDVTLDNGRGVHFDAVVGRNGSADLTVNDDAADVDLAVNQGAFTDDQGAFGEDFTGEFAVDADRAFERKFTFEFAALFQKSANGTGSCGVSHAHGFFSKHNGPLRFEI